MRSSKGQNREQVHLESSMPGLRIYFANVHDETCLRMRSQMLCRRTHSKVLNLLITVHAPDMSLRWLSELQPLSKKNSQTIATGLLQEIEAMLVTCADALSKSRGGNHKFFHLLTGDAIATNDAAARKLYPRMSEMASKRGIQYLLFVLLCASRTY